MPPAKSAVRRRRSAGRPRLEDVAAIDDRLVSIALKEFLAHGYGGASLSRIVRTAGMSKTTLYSRYASKDQLLRAIMAQQIARNDGAATLRLGAGKADLEGGLKAYANRVLEVNLEGEMMRINRLVYAESSRFPELGEGAAERTRLGIEQVARFIRECAEADGVPCADPDSVAEAFILMIRGWYVNVMLLDRK
ncbi:MAG TPA: TetR/AcrR family transcriptional regulator, partial [Nevskiaceae bacterium]|nr:TetR/AcrR family transcriptional regulator [Nevskiaceae bacterium]